MHNFTFESYGVKVSVECSNKDLSVKTEAIIRKSLLGRLIQINRCDADHIFSIIQQSNNYQLSLNGKDLGSGNSELNLFNFFDTMIRLTIAEYAVGLVFMHAGVVVWKGRALVFPADSYCGKTTLVAEFIKRGAVYFSDEYAIFDENGLLHPFPRLLSLRDNDQSKGRKDVSVELLGGTIGVEPIPVAFVILTCYRPNARWNPIILRPGNGVMQMIPQAISVRFNSKFTLDVLKKVSNHAIIVKSLRSGVKHSVDKMIDLIDK